MVASAALLNVLRSMSASPGLLLKAMATGIEKMGGGRRPVEAHRASRCNLGLALRAHREHLGPDRASQDQVRTQVLAASHGGRHARPQRDRLGPDAEPLARP